MEAKRRMQTVASIQRKARMVRNLSHKDGPLIGTSKCLKRTVALPSAQNKADKSLSTKSNSCNIAVHQSRTSGDACRIATLNIFKANFLIAIIVSPDSRPVEQQGALKRRA